MEELKRSLSAGLSSSSVLGASNRLRTLILESTSPTEQEEGLALVWSSLGSNNVVTAQACGDLVADLVEVKRLEAGPTVTQLLASISHGMNFTGIIPALGRIMVHQAVLNIEKNSGGFRGQHAISSSQHPFISVLRSTPSTWSLVLDQCMAILSHPIPHVQANCLAILRPVLLYIFCDPNFHDHFGALRAALLHRLLEMASKEKAVFTFLSSVLTWHQVNCKSSLPEVVQLTVQIFDLSFRLDNKEFIKSHMFRLPSLVLQQVKVGLSPSRTLHLLGQVIDLNLTTNWDVGLLVLDQALLAASHTHHQALLSTCMRMVREGLTTQLATAVLVSTCLQSLSIPSSGIDREASALRADLVRTFYKLEWNDQNKEGWSRMSGHNFDLEACSAAEMVELMHSLPSPTKWLDTMLNLSHSHLTRSVPLLSAIFLCSHEAETVRKALELMLSCVQDKPDLSSPILTLLLHKLSSPSPEPEVKLALLQALPSMAGDKSCISLVIKLVGSLASRPGLACLKLSLLHKLWRLEGRCYPFLQKALQEPVPQIGAAEYRITQATVIRDIVSSHAAQYGSDLLPSLSGLLNQCGGEDGTMAAVIALHGILTLCKEGVIDMQTTIKVLAPKCSKDPRPQVKIGYIKLLGLAPTFRVSGPDYVRFLSTSLAWLWARVGDSTTEPMVLQAAYEAISHFPLEATALRMLPAETRAGLKLPPRYCATPAEAARKPEDVLPYVPAEVWPCLLAPGRESHYTGVESLLRSLIKEEVAALPRAVYNLSQAMQNSGAEPVNYSHLPEQSVLRGVAGAVQSMASTRRELPRHPGQLQSEAKLLSLLLGLMSQDYGRKLPPLDWSFLEPFFHDANLRPLVIAVLCRQTASSRSARTLVERQLGAEQARDTVLAYMVHLDLLAQAVSPQLLGPFVQKSLATALHAADKSSGAEDLKSMFQYLVKVLENPALQPATTQSLAQAVEFLDERIPADQEELFQGYLQVASRLPLKSIERLSSPAIWWEVTPARLYRASCLRTAIACSEGTDTPLTWLNELLEVASKQQADYTFLFRSLLTVITKCRSTTAGLAAASSWLLELMGQVSALVRQATSKPSSTLSAPLPFLLDVFSLSVILLTETDNLVTPRDLLCQTRSARLALQPLAVCRLATQQPGLAGQLADWSLQLARAGDLLASHHRQGLLACLPVFRYSATWAEASMWGRLVLAA